MFAPRLGRSTKRASGRLRGTESGHATSAVDLEPTLALQLAMTANACGFNRSMQHLDSDRRAEGVVNEVPDEDFLY